MSRQALRDRQQPAAATPAPDESTHASLAEWLIDVGHALRSPLSPIRTAAQLMRNPRIDAAQREGLLDIVERQIGELMHRIDELSDLVRIERGALHSDRRPCELSLLFDVVRGRIAGRFEQEGRPLDLPASANVSLVVDQAQVVQALSAILLHAARCTPPGEPVACGLDCGETSIVISIRDQDARAHPGRGAELLAPPVERHGAGIGAALRLADGFLRANGGRLSIVPRQDAQGMEFRIELPRES